MKIFDSHSNTLISLERKNYVKYLGVLINSGLTWKYHISHVASKISRSIGVIAKLKHFVPRSNLLNIYRILIFPYISYGIFSYDNVLRAILAGLELTTF